jgi:phosphopantothenoylcysteine decarboxylase/phosphopantothenate--cysteine ligase
MKKSRRGEFRADENGIERFSPLENRTVLLGICGSELSFKSCDLATKLKMSGADVHPILTSSARDFITPLSLQTLTDNAVYTQESSGCPDFRPEHAQLANTADLVLIAPATADIIAKLATGCSDDLLTTLVFSTRAQVMIAPAMNLRSMEHPAIQHNLEVLQHRYQFEIIPPDNQSSKDASQVCMASLETILATVAARFLTHRSLAGNTILVTAGGTREPIDPVRFIGNRSSGKMGIAMADAAWGRGANVTLISTVDVDRPYPVLLVETALEMQEAVEVEFDSCDALIMTAAVSDYRPLSVSHQKIKTTDSEDIVLELTKNPDILDLLSRVKRRDQVMIGFAAESEGLLSNASDKLRRKNLDVIVGNDISVPDIGFGSDDNAVVILDSEGKRESLPRMPKRAIAEHLCNILADRFATLEKDTVTK